MFRATVAMAALVCSLCGPAACSRSAANAEKAGRQMAAAVAGQNACDRNLVTQQDMAGLLSEPITSVKAIQEDPQTCAFTTAEYSSISVSLRPGLGRATVATWASGKMPVAATPLPGVGERAIWQPTLHEVIAEKGDLLCDIAVMGPPSATAGATKERVGALCNKIFAVLTSRGATA